ncbi:hypothetical protein QE417_003450 [Mucilaginibacter terrae]|uniref:Lipoprotein n=1 Tax=Mucilaginibacter terrae TaxID=1955052 RepID=A0ABU3GX84_9SPHI|nr:hypothetical protein [Mucilaginibacter terrae]
MKKVLYIAILAATLLGTFSSCSNKLCPAYGNSRRR